MDPCAKPSVERDGIEREKGKDGFIGVVALEAKTGGAVPGSKLFNLTVLYLCTLID